MDSEWRKLLLVQNMNGHTNSTDSEWRKLLLIPNMNRHTIRNFAAGKTDLGSHRKLGKPQEPSVTLRPGKPTIGNIGTIHRNHP